jgi:hypothetical protein
MNENQDNSNLQSSSEGNSKQVDSPSEEKDNLEAEQTIESDKEVDAPSEEKDNLESEQTIESDKEVDAPSEEKDNLESEQTIESDKEVDAPSEEKDNLESEQTIESDKIDSINKYSSVEKKGPSIKSSLLLLVLLIALGAGFYFYAYKKNSSFSKTLSEGFSKSFSPAQQSNNLPDNELKKIPVKSQKVTEKIEGAVSPENQPKEMLARKTENVVEKIDEAIFPDKQPKKTSVNLPEKVVEQAKNAYVFDEIISEKDKTINLLRNEILSLKLDLKQKPSTSQRLGIKKPHISGSFPEEQFKEITPQKEKETRSKTNILPAGSLPPNELLSQQSHLQKTSPLKRSEEVKNYLNFVESTGGEFIELIEEGWVRLRALISEYIKSNY